MNRKKITTIDQLAIEHDYYCILHNRNSNDAYHEYDTWHEFYLEWGDMDLDMNLLFRWDIKPKKEAQHYTMEIFIVLQRRGIFIPILIKDIQEKDLTQILDFLIPCAKKLQNIWKPLF